MAPVPEKTSTGLFSEGETGVAPVPEKTSPGPFLEGEIENRPCMVDTKGKMQVFGDKICIYLAYVTKKPYLCSRKNYRDR